MNPGRKIISGAVGFRVFFLVASILITVILSRYLGVENFGRYSWVMSIAMLLSGLALAGGNGLMVRETSRSVGRRVPVIVLRRTALTSIAALGVMAVAAYVFTGDGAAWELLLSVGLLAGASISLVLVSAANRGIGQLKAGQAPELILRPLLFLGLIGWVILTGKKFEAEEFIFLLVAAYVVAALAAGGLLLRGLMARPNLPNEDAEAGWIKSFFNLAIVGWLAVGNAQLLIILTGLFADYSQVGLYRVAAQAALVMSIGLTAIETVQAPQYARAYKDSDFRSLHDLLQQSCRIGVAISAAAMLVLLLVGQPIIEIVLGNDYSAAYMVLVVLAGGQLINSLTGNVGVLMISAKQERKLIIANVAALLATLVPAWLFIPQYGALAAAGAASLGLLLRNAINLWICYKMLGLISLPFAPFLSNGRSARERQNSQDATSSEL